MELGFLEQFGLLMNVVVGVADEGGSRSCCARKGGVSTSCYSFCSSLFVLVGPSYSIN